MTVLGKQSILENSLFNVYSILNNTLLLWRSVMAKETTSVCARMHFSSSLTGDWPLCLGLALATRKRSNS